MRKPKIERPEEQQRFETFLRSRQLKLTGERPISREGEANRNWVLLDFGDLVVHVMDEETRRHYNLEGLWNAGRELELPAEIRPES